MCCVKVTPGPNMTKTQADVIGCLLTGVITALPHFLESFVECLGGNNAPGTDDQYDPGTRTRCNRQTAETRP